MSAHYPLKLCPFCGGNPNQPDKKGGGDERNGYNFLIIISCKCGASMEKSSKETTNGWCIDTGQALGEAITAWNRRVEQKEEQNER